MLQSNVCGLTDTETMCRYENSYLTKAMKILGRRIFTSHVGSPSIS